MYFAFKLKFEHFQYLLLWYDRDKQLLPCIVFIDKSKSNCWLQNRQVLLSSFYDSSNVALFVCMSVCVCVPCPQTLEVTKPLSIFFSLKDYANSSILPKKEVSTGNCSAKRVKIIGTRRCMLWGYLSAQR